MAKKASAPEIIMRGGIEVTLYQDPNLFTAVFRDRVTNDNMSQRILSEMRIAATARFITRMPGNRVCLFHTETRQRNKIMTAFRKEKDKVLYCSHVLRRTPKDRTPGTEIAVDNRIFVEFPKTPKPAELQKLEKKYWLRAIWRFPEVPNGMVFQLTEEAALNPLKIAKLIQSEMSVKTVEPCLIEPKVNRSIPSDPAFEDQWHLLNLGQDGGKPGADCNAPAAWDYTWGDREVTIAIIDDGFDLTHPDLSGRGKIRDPYDATQRDIDPSPENIRDNHGTACAGLAVGARGRGLAIGVAPNCSWMPIRHAGRVGDYEEALAFYHAYRRNAHVISCSWGPYDAYQNAFWPMPSLTRLTIDLCLDEGRDKKGIPIFFAAGNGNEPLALDGYANYKRVIAVAASTNEDKKAYYSDYGKNVWICAPSSGGKASVFTTDRRGHEGYSRWSDYTDSFGGTSAAAPLVAGIAGLLLSINDDLTVTQIKDILKKTAVKINRDSPGEYTDHWGARYSDKYASNGHSLAYGWGRVDAGAAVAIAKKMKSGRS